MTLNKDQFGGIKGTGINHFLVETWDEIMNSLEDPNAAVSLMSIDFEKAFNRMSHSHCISALQELNADEEGIKLTKAFLYGRTMRVKIGTTLSEPKTVPGGSPQGSILGNFLFCVTTNKLSEVGGQGAAVNQDQSIASTVSFADNGNSLGEADSEISEPPSPISRPAPTNESMDDSLPLFSYFRNIPEELEDTVLSQRCTQDEIDANLGLPQGWTDRPLSVKVYVDDLNNIEKVKQSTALSTITATRTQLFPHAIKSEANFKQIKMRAEEMGMKVNSDKTQLLCISGNTGYLSNSYIRTDDEKQITSTNELKILGFWFGHQPNVDVHVNKLQAKFRTRLWSLRHLKKSGMGPTDLLFIYTTMLRPVLDFAAPSYHSLLTAAQTEQIERLQKKSLRVVYGPEISYREAIAIANICTLKERREQLTKRFALATVKNPRYKDGWFPLKPPIPYNTRINRPYLECATRTERMRKNPLTYMRRLLNDDQN